MLLVHQRMSLASRRMLLVNLATAMIADARAAKEVASLEKMTQLQKNPKMILSFDATFAKANDVVDAVATMTAPANQRMPLASQKTVLVNHATTIPDVEARTASHEKMRLPRKHQKMILNFDGTLAANATDVVAAVVMTTAHGNQKMMSPVSRRMLPANLATVMIADVRDAREAAHLEKMMKPLKIQKMILNFDVTFAEENDVVDAVVMTTAPENQRMLLVHQRMSLASRRMLLVNLATAMIADARAAKEVASLEKMTQLQKNPKMILSFDATFAKANDVVDAVVMMTAPANQRMPLASQKMPPVNLVTMTTVNNARVAREAANHE